MNTVTTTAFALGDKVKGFENPITEVAAMHSGVLVSYGPSTTRFYRYGGLTSEFNRRRTAE